MSSKSRFEGYLLTDHRDSPGLPGLPGGAIVEQATLTCSHCSGVWVKNPTRTRPRNYCRKCDRYLCDSCAIATLASDYIHRSFDEIADLVRSGRFQLEGPLSSPVLIPTSRFT